MATQLALHPRDAPLAFGDHEGGPQRAAVPALLPPQGVDMSGPVKRAGGVVVEQDEVGRWVHTFRQSTLGELDICLERGRLTMAGQMPPDETDAAGLGTAVHAGIEAALRAKQDGQWLTVEEMNAVAQDEFTRIMALDGFRFAKYKEAGCRRSILHCLAVFDRELYERIDPLHVELGFGPLEIHADDQRVVRITGTMDLFDAHLGMADWKTAGDPRKYKRGFGGDAWQLDRWGVQGTVYSAACRALGLIDPDGPWPFTYFAFGLGAEVELVETTILRQPADIAWLIDKCLSYCALVEADLGVWPKADNTALCSPKWCGAWAACKGQHYVSVDWPIKP
jgi:hypothetical protein